MRRLRNNGMEAKKIRGDDMQPFPGLDLEISGDAELVRKVIETFSAIERVKAACEEAKKELARLREMPWPTTKPN